MATSPELRAIAGTLHDGLMAAAVAQLRAVAPKLTSVSGTGSTAAAAADSALAQTTLSPEVRNFVLTLARENMLSQLTAIADALEAYDKVGVAREVDADVTSALELDQPQQEQISAELRSRYGADMKVSFKVDESLLGGLVIRVGDQVLDNSLRTRLSAIQRNMLAS